jgi:hypothetical protein
MQRRYRVLRTRRGRLLKVPPATAASVAPPPSLIHRHRGARPRPHRGRHLLWAVPIAPPPPPPPPGAGAFFSAGVGRMPSQSVLSTQFFQVPIRVWSPSGYNPTSDPVQFAFTPLTYPETSPTSGSWVTGSWVTFPGPAYWAQALVGPANGGTALPLGTYQVWVKITDSSAVPVLQPCLLKITP